MVDLECSLWCILYTLHIIQHLYLYAVESYECLNGSYLGGSGIGVQLNTIGGLNFYVCYICFISSGLKGVG